MDCELAWVSVVPTAVVKLLTRVFKEDDEWSCRDVNDESGRFVVDSGNVIGTDDGVSNVVVVVVIFGN